MSAPTRGSRPLKESVFVQVKTADDGLAYFDTTDRLGRKMPYDRPEATCAMRSTPTVIAFTLLKYSNATRARAAEGRLELPRGPLDRTERRAEVLGASLAAGEIAVEIGEDVHKLLIRRDENNVATLETAEGDDVMFELPRDRVRLTIVLRAPRGSKFVAASFQGHVGKPGSQETVVRVAAIALNFLSGLPVFRLVAGIETVNVPPSPTRYLAVRPVRKETDQVRVAIPVRLWTAGDASTGPQPVGQTMLDVRIDLDQANPLTSRLLFHLTTIPEQDAEMFEPYRAIAIEAAGHAVSTYLSPDEVTDLVYSIVTGELTDGDLGRLRGALATLTGLDLNPREFRLFPVAA